jgi:hypothetical protein
MDINTVLMWLFVITTIASASYNYWLVNRYAELYDENQKMANLINQIVPVAEIISKNTGWALNKDLNKIVSICNQFRNMSADDKMETNEEQKRD